MDREEQLRWVRRHLRGEALKTNHGFGHVGKPELIRGEVNSHVGKPD